MQAAFRRRSAIDGRAAWPWLWLRPLSAAYFALLLAGVVLHGNARPMVHGVGEPIMAGLPSYHDAALPTSVKGVMTTQT